MKSVYYLMIAMAILLLSCNQSSINNYEAYVQWLHNPENNLSKTRYVNGLEIKVRYSPVEFLAYRELQDEVGYSQQTIDSVVNLYKGSLTFVMEIGPDERKDVGGDIMYRGVGSYADYTKRVYAMNFDIEQYVSIKTQEGSVSPVLSNMENVYGLTKSRSIVFVFAQKQNGKDLLNQESLDFVYDDDLFGLGINHFKFKSSDINAIPIIDFWKVK
ncbi:MAG: hypothetical protein HRT71_09640 [Flavobacteriales bacterium]|nr:hypothetical protein [Flavobacteriales bacterium]